MVTIYELLGDRELHEYDFVNETLSNVRKRGIDLTQHAPHNFAERHPEAVSSADAIQRYAGHNYHKLLKIGMKLVNGLVVQGVGKEATQISIPLLIALGLQNFEGGAEVMIGAFVALTWAVYQVVAPVT